MAFEQVGNLRGAEARGRGNKDMNMVDVGFHLQQSQPVAVAAFLNEAFGLGFHLAGENLTTVFWNPH